MGLDDFKSDIDLSVIVNNRFPSRDISKLFTISREEIHKNLVKIGGALISNDIIYSYY